MKRPADGKRWLILLVFWESRNNPRDQMIYHWSWGSVENRES